MYYGDFNPGDGVRWYRTFVNTSGVSTAVTSLSAKVIRLSDVTDSQSGVTLTASGGLIHVAITTASSSTFYAAVDDFALIVIAGTVSSNSVNEYTLGQFSIGRLAANTFDANVTQINGASPSAFTMSANVVQIAAATVNTASAQLGVNVVNIGGTAAAASVLSANIVQIQAAAVNTAAAQLGVNAVSIATGAIAAATFSAGAIDAAAIAANAIGASEIADNAIDAAALASDIWTKSLGTEAYASDGAVPTVAQALFAILQNICEFAITTTTITVKKLDKSTTAQTFGLDSATTPTSRTRLT